MSGIIHINPESGKVLRVLIPGLPPLTVDENKMAGSPLPMHLPGPTGQPMIVGAVMRFDFEIAYDDQMKPYRGVSAFGTFVYHETAKPVWWDKKNK